MASVRKTVLTGVLATLAGAGFLMRPAPGSPGPVYAIGRESPYLFRIDPEDGSPIDSVRITLPGQFPTQGNGLAIHPLTGELWAILRLLAVYGRELAILDPWTGRATGIGNVGTSVSALAFDDDGNLYGVTGQSGDPAGTLCRVNPVTAELDSVAALSLGSGHALAYNPEEEFFVHATGEEAEIIDLYSFAVTPFLLSGHAWSSPKALTYAGDDLYYFAVEDSLFLTIDGNGVCDSVGVTVPTKGLSLGRWTVDAPFSPDETPSRISPNPFRAGTVRIVLARPGAPGRRLAVFDARGRRVAETDPVSSGGTAFWSGRDATGRPVPAGVYFLAGRKLVVVR